MRKFMMVMAATLALAASAAQAALLDLASRNLELGALIFSTDEARIFFLGPDVEPAGDFFDISDADLNVLIDGFPSDPTSAVLFENSTSFLGEVVDFEIDLAAGVGEGLFEDTLGRFALARVSFPAGLSRLPGGDEEIEQDGLGVEVFDVTIVPLPAALPMALAGFASLALAGRGARRRA